MRTAYAGVHGTRGAIALVCLGLTLLFGGVAAAREPRDWVHCSTP